MKIASSSIGTLQQPQAAKHLYNYQWSWNAVNETVSGGATDPLQTQGGSSISIVPGGIKCSRHGSLSNRNTPYVDFYDDYSSKPNISGVLNGVDTARAGYMHGIFDFTNAPQITAKADSALQLYWYQDGSKYEGGNCIKRIQRGNITILVWNCNNPAGGTAVGSPSPWASIGNQPEGPVTIEPYWNGGITLTGGPGGTVPYWIWYGMVLSDRILTDIPLPVATHVG